MSLIKPSLERLLADVGPRRHRELHESLKDTLERLQVDLDKIKKVDDLKDKKELTISEQKGEDSIEDNNVIGANKRYEIELDANDKKEDGEETDDELRVEINEEMSEEMSEENSEKQSQKTEETESTRPSTPARSRPSSAALARASISSIYSSAYAGDLPTLLLDAYWQPFKLALDNSMPIKIRILALDLLQKMVAHKLLVGESPINSATMSTPPSSKRSSLASKVGNFSDVNNLTFLDASVSNEEGFTLPPQELHQIDDVISSICSMYSGPSTDEQVQLQILKILLTLMTCETVEIHGLSLLKIVMTLINQYVFAGEKMPVISNTARASLTQVVNIIIGRMEDRESPPLNLKENNEGERNTEDLEGPIQQSTIQFTSLRYDVYITFRLLCNLSIRVETQTTSFNSTQQKLTVAEELHQKGRTLALDLLLTIFSNSGPVFQRTPLFVSLIKSHLCVSLSQNAVSANTTIFELSLSLFLMTLRYFRAPLKNELEVLFSEIYLKFLDMSQTAPQQTQLILEALLKICSDPQTLVDVYVNYDCDINMSSLFERIVNILSKVAQRKRPRESQSMFGSLVGGNDKSTEAANLQERRSKLMGLKGLVGIVESLVTWSSGVIAQKKDSKKEHTGDGGTQETATAEMNGDSAVIGVISGGDMRESVDTLTRPQPSAKSKNPIILLKSPLAAITMQHDNMSTSSVSSTVSTHSNDHERFEEMASRKQILLQTLRLFNEKPIEGVQVLVMQGFITDGVPSIAAWLMNTPGLSKVAIGEYLGAGKEEQIRVMHHFVDRMDFTGLGFVTALRKFLKTFRLPGESQKISRIMEKFADRYCENNPDSFSGGADTAYTLSYSVIMLNVDQHSPKVKAPMTPPEFIRNNRGIDANFDLPEDFLLGIYDDIHHEEIVMEEDIQAKTFEKEGNKRKAYLFELAQMQKRSQMLLTYEKPRSAIGYRTAGNVDFVKPMFQIACWPLVATLSLAFEEAEAEEVQPAVTGTTDWTRVNSDAIEFALRGFAGAIQIAGIFKMDVERDAFVSSLAKLTGLNHVTEMKPKNVAAIRTLLNVANTSGDYLDASWLNVLKIISSMDRLQLIGNTPAEQEVNGLDYQQIDPSLHMPANGKASANGKTSNKGANSGTAPRFNATPRRGSLSGLMREFQSQDFLIAIDRIFTNSVQLSGPAIVHFFEALCAVSNDEVRSTNPRMFSLQRIIEIAYYNMGRIRFEWVPLWKILQPYFNTMGCNLNTTVSTFAIDSLRQLSMKFLDRDELTHFHTQSEFLKPFEHIIRNNSSPTIHDLIIQSLVQMIMARAQNIKSGWKSIFIVFGRTAQDEKLSLVEHTFGILHMVHQKYFDYIGAAFVDYINCVLEFAMNAVDEKIVSGALKLLARCAKQLMIDHEEAPSGEDDVDEVKPPSNSILEKQDSETSLKKLKPIDEEQFFLRWFPVVSALSRITLLAQSQDVRTRALDTLFDVLKTSGEDFEVEPWRKIFRSVLMPLFDDLNDPDFGRKDTVSTVWVQILTQMINLYHLFFDKLGSQPEFIEKLLSLMLSMVGQLDQLGQMGIVCFYQLVLQNATKFDESLWEVVTSALEKIFDVTTPIELFKVQEKMEADKAEAENAKKYPSLISQDPTPTNLPNPGLLLSSEGEMSSPRNLTSPKNHVIDFASVTSKCAVHLSAILCVRDLTIRDSSYHSMPTTRRSSLPAHESSIYTPSQEHPPPTFSVALLSPSIRNRWIDCIYKSYTFAHNFNENHALRSYLLQEDYVEKLPNLNKQETVSITVHISLLFDCYRHFGDNDTTLMRSPLDESKQALDSFFSYLTQPQKHQCDILNWSSFPTQPQKQQRDFLSWSSIPTVVYHEVTITAWAQETDFDNPKVFKALKAQIPWFFKSAIRLVEVGNVEVRKVIREFLDRIADHIVIE